MRLSGNRYDEIETVIVELFKRISINKFPLDCFEICKQIGIRIVPYSRLSEKERTELSAASKDGCCALFEIEKDKFVWVIFYNDKMSKHHIRFTIMHELGHIILDHSEHSDLAESEANYFAKYALAPPPLVHKLQIEDYIELSERFDISYECALYAMRKYSMWLRYGSLDFLAHEVTLISLFQPFLI